MARIRSKHTPTFRYGQLPSYEQSTVGHSILEVFSTFRTYITDDLDVQNQIIREHNGAYVCDGRVFKREEFLGEDNPYDLIAKDKADWVSFDEYDRIYQEYGFCDLFGLDTQTKRFRIPCIPRIQYTPNLARNDLSEYKQELSFSLIFMVQLATQYEEMSIANISETINSIAQVSINEMNAAASESIAKLQAEGLAFLSSVAFYQDYLRNSYTTEYNRASNQWNTINNALDAQYTLISQSYAKDSLYVRPTIVHIDASNQTSDEGFKTSIITFDVDYGNETYTYKGTVNSFSELPTSGNRNGDEYGIMDTDGYIKEAYVWESNKWSPAPTVLGHTIKETIQHILKADGKLILYPQPNRIYFIDGLINGLEIRDIPQSFYETIIFYESGTPTNGGFSLTFADDVEIVNPENIDRDMTGTKYVMSIMNGRVAVGVREGYTGNGYDIGNTHYDANPVTDEGYSTSIDSLSLLYDGAHSLFNTIADTLAQVQTYNNRITKNTNDIAGLKTRLDDIDGGSKGGTSGRMGKAETAINQIKADKSATGLVSIFNTALTAPINYNPLTDTQFVE